MNYCIVFKMPLLNTSKTQSILAELGLSCVGFQELQSILKWSIYSINQSILWSCPLPFFLSPKSIYSPKF